MGHLVFIVFYRPEIRHHPPATMKFLVVLCAAVALAACQQHHGGHHQQHGSNHNLEQLVAHEVAALLQQNPGMTEGTCAQKCDDVFALVATGDETMLDRECAFFCKCEIAKDCKQQLAAM